MADLGGVYNSEDNNETNSYEPVPEGEYSVQIVSSNVKANRAGTGTVLQLVFEILDDDYRGRKIFENLNISHPNEIAQNIARKSLNEICQACNLESVEDSEELHDIPMIAKVYIDVPKDPRYEPSNKIKKYKSEVTENPFDM